MKNILSRILLLSVFVALSSSNVLADNIIIQSSTSLKNSGFYRYLAPILKQYTGVEIRVVAVGTGQAIKNMKNCDGDVLITHSKNAELEFLKTGYGLKRFEFMYNNWVIVGPRKAKTEINIRGNEIREIIITLDTQKHSSNKHLMDDITRILLDNEGNIPVSIVVKNNSEKIKLNLPFANVNTSKSFEEKLDSIVGLQNVFYKH